VEGEVEGVVNPATGDTITAVPRGTEADVDRAVEAPTSAVPEWLLSMYGLEDYTQIKHVMAKIDR
jgi:delta 1-pyrroline-5-carboxylate dehydrogenase